MVTPADINAQRALGWPEYVALPPRALTLWQPWASLVAIEDKGIETRSWATKYRGPILIHASARKPQHISFGTEKGAWHCSDTGTHFGRALWRDVTPSGGLFFQQQTVWLPLMAGLATAVLVDCVPIIDPRLCEWHAEHAADLVPCAHSAIDGQVIVHAPWRGYHTTVRVEEAYGDYTPGRFAWLFSDVQKLEEPIPMKGKQGLWNTPLSASSVRATTGDAGASSASTEGAGK